MPISNKPLSAIDDDLVLQITSRHHDGFSMYDTALSDYKVTNSPLGVILFVSWLMPAPDEVMSNSASIVQCWTGITQHTVSVKRVDWPGLITWNSCMDRYANSARITAKLPACGSIVIGLSTSSMRAMPIFKVESRSNMISFTT